MHNSHIIPFRLHPHSVHHHRIRPWDGTLPPITVELKIAEQYIYGRGLGDLTKTVIPLAVPEFLGPETQGDVFIAVGTCHKFELAFYIQRWHAFGWGAWLEVGTFCWHKEV